MDRRSLLAGLTGLSLSSAVSAKPSYQGASRPVALSIGISEYQHAPDLPSAVPDASLIAATLLELDFDVSISLNPTKSMLLRDLARLRLRAKDASLVVIYIAAHGAMISGQSHVFAADLDLGHPQGALETLPESIFLQAVNDQPRQKVLFLDTCRENDLNGQVRETPTHPFTAGVHVGYATQPGAPAMDGADGHSPFARALQQNILRPNLDLPEISRLTRLDVLQKTNGAQVPWDRSSLLLPVQFS